MSARQLRFFDHPKPLLERFGADFFRALPPRPGVYIMSDENGRVLYVGQSKNLRVRLGAYRNANPDHVPRKVIRLVHAVRRINLEECPTAALACVRENELLRTHRPKFNSMNTYPKAYCFSGLSTEQANLTLWVTTEPSSTGKLYGAFKRRSVQGYAALLRLLWTALHQAASPTDFPHRLLSGRPPVRYGFPREHLATRFDVSQLLAALEAYLEGVSPELIELLTARLPLAEQLLPFQRTMQTTDLELIKDFYEFGPRRNHALREQHGIQGQQIPQERLDDLLALSRLGAHSSPKA